MLHAFMVLGLLSSQLSYADEKTYLFNFYIGSEKITINITANVPQLTIDNEIIKCQCGKMPVTVLKIDNQLFAFCEEHRQDLIGNSCSKVECSNVDNSKKEGKSTPKSTYNNQIYDSELCDE